MLKPYCFITENLCKLLWSSAKNAKFEMMLSKYQMTLWFLNAVIIIFT